ncbi:SRPBCC family protein [Prosthecobacter sp.]|uniref:SRPBCC family protein n=1 Tax=Prosthecobacter sp. TaxID=1965333 RepID=UPI0037849694
MPSAAITEHMPTSAAAVFDLLHDYSRRLEWDTLLREARFTRGHTSAGVGATTLCVGKPLFGIIGIETTYVTFNRGVIAAVSMINRPPFFQTFAASIRHQNTGEGSSLTYRFSFRARPCFLRWLLEPIMLVVLRHETRQRLRALSRFLASTPR